MSGSFSHSRAGCLPAGAPEAGSGAWRMLSPAQWGAEAAAEPYQPLAPAFGFVNGARRAGPAGQFWVWITIMAFLERGVSVVHAQRLSP